jgi:poly(3-hydroxybutyrate) depolymerase
MMKMRSLLFTCLAFVAPAFAGEDLALDIDPERITVSGISSGGQMATQLHIAYSDIFSGAAILSGGPYNCARSSLLRALKLCTTNTEEPLPVEEFVADISTAAAAGEIADPENLADDRVWLFRGTADSKVSALVHWAGADLYARFVPADRMRRVDNVDADHVFPAKGQGNDCHEVVPPYVGDCEYDGAGELLSFLYPGLTDPESGQAGDVLAVELPGAAGAELLETAYLYVPGACEDGAQSCALHLVLHGCAQSAEVVGTDFIEMSGFLPWAEANNIVLAFPQVAKSMALPMNPHGCWDWWGYTGDDYAHRDGKQQTVLVDWIRALMD